MQQQTAKCINFDNCTKADNKEIITIAEGQDLLCPNPDCNQPLILIQNSSARKFPLVPAIALASLVILVGICVPIFSRGNTPPSEGSNTSATGNTAVAKSGIAGTGSNANLFINSHWVYYNNNGGIGSLQNLPGADGLQPGEAVLRIHIEKIPKQIHDIGLSYHFDTISFSQGETVTFKFKARATGKNLIAPQMQRDSPPQYEACWTKFIQLTPEWKEYSYTFTTAAYAPKEGALVFKLGQSTGTIDLANVTLIRGKDATVALPEPSATPALTTP